MRMTKIRFDDPKDLADSSWIFLTVMRGLELLDYARRHFQREGDRRSIQRAKEIRKFYKQIIRDHDYLVRSIIPDDVIHEHFKMTYERIKKLEASEIK
jgi:hypothetical protein